MKQGRSAFDDRSPRDQLIDPPQLFRAEPDGHAQVTQIAVGAGYFDGVIDHSRRSVGFLS